MVGIQRRSPTAPPGSMVLAVQLRDGGCCGSLLGLKELRVDLPCKHITRSHPLCGVQGGTWDPKPSQLLHGGSAVGLQAGGCQLWGCSSGIFCAESTQGHPQPPAELQQGRQPGPWASWSHGFALLGTQLMPGCAGGMQEWVQLPPPAPARAWGDLSMWW